MAQNGVKFNPKQADLIDEYYRNLLGDDDMKKHMNFQIGLVYARVGGHAYWPARVRLQVVDLYRLDSQP